jgi:hypothetical protein
MLCPDPPDLEPLALTLHNSLIGVAVLFALQLIFFRRMNGPSQLLSGLPGSRRPALYGWLLFFTVITARLALLSHLPVPLPGIHDELSYLLMGDTFAHGRLSNPPHPMWISFETFHVNWFPRYASMYPPAQGLILAVGQLLGHPWIGVVLSCAVMVAVIYWMLLAWLPPRWALLGGGLVWLKFCIASYWINSYWGGAAAATGGALLMGALGRLRHKPRVRDALLLALGIAILANSRPYEGLLFSLPAGAYLLYLMFRTSSHPLSAAARKKVLRPLIGVLLLTAASMTYYNHQLTGHALLFPHTLNTRTYHSAPMYLFQSSKPELHYRNQQFEEFYNGWEREEYDHTWESVKCLTWLKSVRLFAAYGWWGMLLALAAVPRVLRDARMRLPWIMLGLVTAGTYMVVWSNAHYAAPATCLVFLLFLQSLRHLRLMCWRSWRWGAVLARTCVFLLTADTTIAAWNGRCDVFHWTCQGDASRFAVQHQLEALPGKHLVLVRYGDDHNIHDDWVYNGADIDSAKIVWAREVDEEQDAKLLQYFHDRKIWLVTPDTDNTYLAPYTPPPDRNSN